MLHLPYLGDSPTEADCKEIRIKPDAAAGDLGVASIKDSFIKHSKYPDKQGTLAATILEFCVRALREVKAGRYPEMESIYKVGHRERTVKTPKGGQERQVQTRTVCAPGANVKGFHSLYLQFLMRAWKGVRLRKSCIWVGQTMAHGGHFKFDHCFSKFPFLVEIDASRFDQRAIRPFVLAAFAVIRSSFGPAEENDIAFVTMAHNFINGIIVGPDGYAFSCEGGIKSGDA